MKKKLLGVVVALLGASSPIYAQGGWTFTTIDNPAAITGAGGTFAQGINDPGKLSGTSTTAPEYMALVKQAAASPPSTIQTHR
jgi:hypothetical protein